MAAVAAPKKFKFRNVGGTHVEPDPTRPVIGPDGKKVRDGDMIYPRGAIVETDTDLEKLNVPGFDPKFVRLDQAEVVKRYPGESPTAHAARLAELAQNALENCVRYFDEKRVPDMSLDQLQLLAAEEGWDLSKVKPDRDSVLRAVRAEIDRMTKVDPAPTVPQGKGK